MVTYTTTYNLAKPTVGDDEDVWGGYLNGNFDTLESLLKGTTSLTSLSLTGTLTAPYLRLTGTGDASASSTTHAFQVGASGGGNIIMDANEIMARSNGAVSSLHLNADGGSVTLHNNTTAGTFTIGGNTVWHAGNDGSGSGLDADLLDGQHGSYYQTASDALTTSTTFGGDVSGTYNAIVVADDSHTHDTRYYTETEINTFINRSYVSNHSASDLPVGWYTIAQNTGDRAVARFALWDTKSGRHQSVIFYASHHYGTDNSNTLTVLDNSYFSGNPFRYIRIKDAGTYDGAALQVYIDDAGNSVNVAIVGDDVQSSGWDIVDFLADATAPSLVSNWSNFGTRAQIDLNQIAQGGFATTGPIYADGDTTQYRVWSAGNDGSGSGLDADLWDGNQFASYLDQAVLTTSTPTFNELGVTNVYLGGSLYHSGDTDTRLLFGTNTITLQTGGSSEVTVNASGVRLGDTGNGYFQPVTGSYGSVQIDGGAHNGWEGYSIGGRAVFMHNNSTSMGLYDDVNNHWAVNHTFNGATQLYHDGSSKIQTTSTGANITGDLNAVNNIYLASTMYHAGDTDTYIDFDTNQINFVTGGATEMQINGDGVFLNGAALHEEYVALSGTTPTCDPNSGGGFSLTLSGNTTFTFGGTTASWSTGFIVELTGNATTAYTVTWPTSVEWAGGTAPDAPASGETDVFVFYSRDGGTTWYGVQSIDAAA